ncbi:MAG: hypothetical protein GF341_11240 [candidate division Zixibacteria bacterium]|nr:hypothetical protein [candidate division Zixibacteria bacterium]
MSRKVKFANYSMWRDKRHEHDWYSWCIFVDETDDVLDQIERVEYELHPTFPDPIQVRDDRETKFALFSSGWGEFETAIRVFFQDGTTLDTTHQLKLAKDDWPKGERPDNLTDENAQKVYNGVTDTKHRWRKVDSVARTTGLSTDAVESILKSLEKQQLVRQSQLRSLDNQTLWGATARVGMLPRRGHTGMV